MLTLKSAHQNIYFQKPTKENTAQQLYSTHSLKSGNTIANKSLLFACLQRLQRNLGPFSARTIGFLTALEKNEHLIEVIEIFKNPLLKIIRILPIFFCHCMDAKTKLSTLPHLLEFCHFATYKCSHTTKFPSYVLPSPVVVWS